MKIVKKSVFTKENLTFLGFKECQENEIVRCVLEREDVISIVLTDYNGDRQIFHRRGKDTFVYDRPFQESDYLIFEYVPEEWRLKVNENNA